MDPREVGVLTTPSLINQPQIFPRVSTANYDVETSAVFWGKDEASVHIGGGRAGRSGMQPQHLLTRVKVWGSTVGQERPQKL